MFVLVGHEGRECERLYGTSGMLAKVQDVVFYGLKAKQKRGRFGVGETRIQVDGEVCTPPEDLLLDSCTRQA